MRIVNYLTDNQRFALFAKFPSAEDLKGVRAKNFVIAGDSILRHIPSYLQYDVPVICAPGVSMCTPDKDKWIVRFWAPILENMIRHPKPHFIFHLGTNNVSNHKENAPTIVLEEAKQLCEKIWKLGNRMIHITFSAESDSRIHFLDFSNVLREPGLYRYDQAHLSDQGVKEFTGCMNDFLYRQYFQ